MEDELFGIIYIFKEIYERPAKIINVQELTIDYNAIPRLEIVENLKGQLKFKRWSKENTTYQINNVNDRNNIS